MRNNNDPRNTNPKEETMTTKPTCPKSYPAPEKVIGYRYYDAGEEHRSFNGRPRFWLVERVTTDNNPGTSWNGKSTLVSQFDIDELRDKGFSVELDTHIAD
jgi:hypothetical protein